MKNSKFIIISALLIAAIALNPACKKPEKEYSVSSVSLDKEEITIAEGDTACLVCTVKPKQAKNHEVKWKSSDPSTVSVSQQGVIAGVALGEAVITVTSVDGNKKASCKVKVSNDVNGVTLDQHKLMLAVTGVTPLIATVTPENATNKKVTWKSGDDAIATVDTTGRVRGIAVGKTEIVVTTAQGSFTDTCFVTVDSLALVKVISVSLDKTTLSLTVGASEKLKATVAPSDASNKDITWASSDTVVAAVDHNGNITAKTGGNATITVTTVDGGKTAICSLSVRGIAVTAVTLNTSSITLADIGDTEQLTATVLPANAANKKVIWTSSNRNIADVDTTGKVTAMAAGTAIVTVRTEDGNKTASCSVTVSRIAVTGVSLDKTSIALDCGDTLSLHATVAPSNATNKNVTWRSSNTAVATVDSNGKITARSRGSANITVTTEEGNKTATCSLKVRDIYVLTENSVIKNGVSTPLSGIGSGTATSMCLVGNDVYVVGILNSSPLDANSSSAIWKNGTRTETIDGAMLNSIYASGNNIYAVGDRYSTSISEYIATYWRLNTAGTAADGWANFTNVSSSANSVFISGNIMYSGGHEDAERSNPVIWETSFGAGGGTVETVLSRHSNYSAYVKAISVSGGNVYAAGYMDLIAVFWRNGERETLPANNTGEPNSIYVAANGDVYVAGRDGVSDYARGVVWKIVGTTVTTYQTLPELYGNALSVFVAGTDVYVCGRSRLYKNREPVNRIDYSEGKQVIVVE